MAEYPRMDPYRKARYDQGVDAKIVIMGNTGAFRFVPAAPPEALRYPALPRARILTRRTGVGKTSLLHRYTQGKFDPKNTTSTTGAFFVTKKVNVDGTKVRLQLWDTAGQERFRSMVRVPLPLQPLLTVCLTPGGQAPMYYRGANAALLLYDITNASSFEDVRGWLEGEPRDQLFLMHA